VSCGFVARSAFPIARGLKKKISKKGMLSFPRFFWIETRIEVPLDGQQLYVL
jgi:hypothetical protein